MAKSVVPYDQMVRTLKPGLENAEKAEQALREIGAEVTVPFGPFPDGKYFLHITYIPSDRMDVETWLAECEVEEVGSNPCL